MHEILTLQFGPLANYVGTHFWNTQESYFTYNASEGPSIVDHDINFRPGIGSDGSDTYTPRALIYDLKSGFGSLRKTNVLYEIADQNQQDGVWHGQQELQAAPPILPSPYQEALESGLPTFQMQSKDVRYWSDYNRVYYHPRSLVQLSPQSLTSQLSAFESFSAGVDLFRDINQEIGGIFDRDVRLFAEECDSLQGFQVFGSSDNAWGGFMSKYIEELEEDFGKKSVWVWSLEDGKRVERMKQLQQITNSTQTLSYLADKVSACIRTTSSPPCLPSYVRLESDSPWSTSALIASAIESVTLPTRLRAGPIRHTKMAFMEDALHGEDNRKLWTLSAQAKIAAGPESNGNEVSAPVPINGTVTGNFRLPIHAIDNGGVGHDIRNNHDGTDLGIDFTPSLPHLHSVFPSLAVASAQPRLTSHVFTLIESLRTRISDQSFSSVQTQYQQSRYSVDDDTIVDVYRTPLPFPLLDSFPAHLFSFAHGGNQQLGTSSATDTSRGREDKTNVNINAALSTTSRSKNDLLMMRDVVVGQGGRTLNLVDTNDREALYDDLTRLAGSYAYGYEDDFSDNDNGQDD